MIDKDDLGRIIENNWHTIYNDEWFNYSYFTKDAYIYIDNNDVTISFPSRKHWFIKADKTIEAKSKLKKILIDSGLKFKNLKTYGKTNSIYWMHNDKYVGIYRIKFTLI